VTLAPPPKPSISDLNTTYDDNVFLEITESARYVDIYCIIRYVRISLRFFFFRRSLEEFMIELEKTPEGRAKLEELLSPISTSYDQLSVPPVTPLSPEEEYQFYASPEDAAVESDFFSTDNASETSIESFDFDMLDISEDISNLTWNFNEPTVYQAPETGECLQVIDAIIAAQDLIDETLRAKMDKQLEEFVNCPAELLKPILDEDLGLVDSEMSAPESSSTSSSEAEVSSSS